MSLSSYDAWKLQSSEDSSSICDDSPVCEFDVGCHVRLEDGRTGVIQEIESRDLGDILYFVATVDVDGNEDAEFVRTEKLEWI